MGSVTHGSRQETYTEKTWHEAAWLTWQLQIEKLSFLLFTLLVAQTVILQLTKTARSSWHTFIYLSPIEALFNFSWFLHRYFWPRHSSSLDTFPNYPTASNHMYDHKHKHRQYSGFLNHFIFLCRDAWCWFPCLGQVLYVYAYLSLKLHTYMTWHTDIHWYHM